METRNEHLEYMLFRIDALQKALEKVQLENLMLKQKLENRDATLEVLTYNYNYLNNGN